MTSDLQRAQPQPTPALLESLHKTAQSCRGTILDMLTSVNSSHLGCSFSVIDILVVLYHCFVNIEQVKQQAIDRDYIILSKGHSASALYAALHSVGLIPGDMLKNYHRGLLAGHPMRDLRYGIEASTGSLGHGLSIGVGLALAAQQRQSPSRVFVLVGDGECQEGAIWEALTMAARFKLNNLTVIVDYNNLQGLDKSDDLMPGTLHEKFQAFCCNPISIDGHNHGALIHAINACGMTEGPDVIIAHTIKGKGIACIENKLEWHYRSFKPEQYMLAKQEIEQS